VCCYSNYAASITYSLNWKWFFYSTLFCTLQFLSLLSRLDWALTSSVSLEGTLDLNSLPLIFYNFFIYFFWLIYFQCTMHILASWNNTSSSLNCTSSCYYCIRCTALLVLCIMYTVWLPTLVLRLDNVMQVYTIQSIH